LLLENVLQDSTSEKNLLYLVTLGDINKVCNLLDQDADPNIFDDNNMTAMHYAAQYGYVDIVNTLLEHPKLITTHIAQGEKSPFFIAMRYNQCTIIERILATCTINSSEPLCYAARNGLLDIVHILLAHTVDGNTPNTNKAYPLFAATHGGHLNIMKLLITEGATLDCRIKNNASLLHCAAAMGHTHIVQFLIEQGADINLQDNNYKSTPLHAAATHGYIQIVKLLLQNNAHVNEQNNKGKTALHFAVINGHISVIQELITQDTIDIQITDNDGYEAAYYAKTKSVVQLLNIHARKEQHDLENELQTDEDCCTIQ